MRTLIIIITSDHGQEFYEHGLYGHNSAFNYEQVKVPFISPSTGRVKHKTVTQLTSHIRRCAHSYDLRIGVENDASDYSNGNSLFDVRFQ